MKEMKSRYLTGLVCTVLCCLMLASCRGGAYLNKGFKYQEGKPPVLAIFPVPGDGRIVDEAFKKSFSNKPKINNVIYPDELRRNSSDVVAMAVTTPPGGQTTANNLRNTLGAAKYDSLVRAIGSPALVLVPTEFRIGELLGLTLGHFVFTLYDVQSGTLIYRNAYDFNVNIQGEKAFFLLSHIATSRIADDINKIWIYE